MKTTYDLLSRIPFSSKEMEIVELFKKKPEHVLAVSELLIEKGFFSESCDLLASFLERYPNRLPVRVAYSKTLLKQGLVLDAHKILTDFGPFPFESNSLANHIGLQTSLLLGKESTTLRIFQFLEDHYDHSPLSRKLFYVFQNQGFLETKRVFIQQISGEYSEPILEKFTEGFDLPEETKDHPDLFVIDGFEHFQRTSLKEIFQTKHHKTDYLPYSNIEHKGVDLFSIAKAYASQGLYFKALEIYRKLYMENPGSENLKTQMTAMVEKINEQKKNDLYLDSHLALKMDCVQHLNKKINILYQFLKKIPTEQQPSK